MYVLQCLSVLVKSQDSLYTSHCPCYVSIKWIEWILAWLNSVDSTMNTVIRRVINTVDWGCDEVWIWIWQHLNFERFQQIWNSPSVLSACCRMWIHGKILVPRQILYGMHRQPQSAGKLFFSNSTYHTNYSYWMCNIIFAQWCITL